MGVLSEEIFKNNVLSQPTEKLLVEQEEVVVRDCYRNFLDKGMLVTKDTDDNLFISYKNRARRKACRYMSVIILRQEDDVRC